jgi:glyoxylase-like metal-dependent hydrolase (beta-lactamase superfamily II)
MRVNSTKLSATTVAFGLWFAVPAAMPGQTPPPAGQTMPRPSPAIDLSGYWSPAINEDGLERGAGSEIGDYAGFAINEAGRLWALSYDPSRLTLKHHQCDGYVAPYQMRAVGNFRIWEDRDPHTMQLIAIHIWAQTTEGHRIIWMDGRPHPPAWAPHTYQGFSTGRFVGDALMVNTDHLKQGWLRRNGLPESDQATMVEFIVRHGDHLVDTTIVTDPVFLTEPEVRSDDFFRQPSDHGAWLYACDDGEQIIGRPPDVVPNYPLGAQPFAKEYSQRYKIPLLSGIAGAASIYPEFKAKLKTASDADALPLLKPAPGPAPANRAVDPEPQDGEIHVWPISGNVYMLLGDGGNIVVETGDQGPLVVDTGSGRLADRVIEAIHKLSDKPIQFIVNTSFLPDRTGGNVKLRAAGNDPSLAGSFFSFQFRDAGVGATIVAQQNAETHMVDAKLPAAGYPTDTFLQDRRRKFHNGNDVEIFHEPHAITDGDSIVQFRQADVIVAGDIFNTTQFPFIDIKDGGSVQGEIAALNDILNRTVFQHEGQGGTMVVPGHGYLADEHEVVEYRDMLVIVRDRVRAMIQRGATIEQVKAARVTADYDTRYGTNSGPWTTDMFVEAAYNSLKQPEK